MGSHQGEPTDVPLDGLCAEILQRHHAPVHGAIPVIRSWLAALPPDEAASSLVAEVRTVFAELADHLTTHLAKEETILFPAIVALAEARREDRPRPLLPFPSIVHPIRLMEGEHARIDASMAHLRRLTGGFVAPVDASPACRRALEELGRLEKAVQAHVHVENDRLFPRAVELDGSFP